MSKATKENTLGRIKATEDGWKKCGSTVAMLPGNFGEPKARPKFSGGFCEKHWELPGKLWVVKFPGVVL